MLTDPEFKQIFAALAELLRQPNRQLVLLLGNHDLELALPALREKLTNALCGKSDEARGRLELLRDDGGFCCQVGPARIVCTHGNEVDPWNLVDYAKLTKRGSQEERGLVPQAFDANAGTRLVIDVMNQIKKRYPFIELLKPEAQLVPKLLAVLDPSALGLLSQFAPIAYRLARGELHERGLLGDAAAPGGESSREEMLDHLLNPRSRPVAADHLSTSRERLEQAARTVREGGTALAMPDDSYAVLGFGQYIIDRWRGIDQKEALRRALADWLGDEQTTTAFNLDRVDDTFRSLAQTVGPDVDFLLAGHTHLARALRRPDGGYYFNSGTWMRIIRLERAEDLQPQNFQGVYEALQKGTLNALDQARPQIVHTRPTVVAIELLADGAGARGTLYECRSQAGKPTLLPIGGPFTVGCGSR